MAGSQTGSGADALTQQAWVAELQSQQGFQQVVTAGALLANNTLLPPDHMVGFCSLTTRLAKRPLSQRADLRWFEVHSVFESELDKGHAMSLQQLNTTICHHCDPWQQYLRSSKGENAWACMLAVQLPTIFDLFCCWLQICHGGELLTQ